METISDSVRVGFVPGAQGHHAIVKCAKYGFEPPPNCAEPGALAEILHSVLTVAGLRYSIVISDLGINDGFEAVQNQAVDTMTYLMPADGLYGTSLPVRAGVDGCIAVVLCHVIYCKDICQKQGLQNANYSICHAIPNIFKSVQRTAFGSPAYASPAQSHLNDDRILTLLSEGKMKFLVPTRFSIKTNCSSIKLNYTVANMSSHKVAWLHEEKHLKYANTFDYNAIIHQLLNDETLIAAVSGHEIRAIQRHTCQLQFIRTKFGEQMMGFPFVKKNHPALPRFNKALILLWDHIENVFDKYHKLSQIKANCPQISTSTPKILKPLDLINLFGVFCILFAGFSFGLIIFLVELVVIPKRISCSERKKRNSRVLLEAIKHLSKVQHILLMPELDENTAFEIQQVLGKSQGKQEGADGVLHAEHTEKCQSVYAV